MPDFSFEQSVEGLVCGVDEVGRGPLAGPVMAAAALLDRDAFPDFLRSTIRDSKKLSAGKREHLSAVLLETPGVEIVVAQADVAEIDRLNILRATHLAMRRAVEGLSRRPEWALIDGNRAPEDFPCAVRCIVKGDDLSLSIAAASIVAKTTRDRLMTELSASFPVYGWDRNKGYGSAEHRAAIRRHGATEHHRRSFARQGELFSAWARQV